MPVIYARFLAVPVFEFNTLTVATLLHGLVFDPLDQVARIPYRALTSANAEQGGDGQQSELPVYAPRQPGPRALRAFRHALLLAVSGSINVQYKHSGAARKAIARETSALSRLSASRIF